jgi:hypothetical protein
MMGTNMPRIIPDIENVIISYSYSVYEPPPNSYTPFQDTVPLKIMRTRFGGTYRYSGIIVPSAKTGRYAFEVGIQEGDYADANSLSNATPNPASSTISFEFSLAKPNHTRLVITNVLGQVVETLVDM